MSVPALCSKCGLKFTSRVLSFENSTHIPIEGCSEQCPKCGGWANIQDGTYDFVGKVMSAVRAPGVLRDDVLAFQNIAKAVQSGKISSEDAALQLFQINSALATLWKWTNENGGAIAVVLMIIALYLAIWTKEAADAGSEQAHQDVQQMMQVQDRLYEALQLQHAPALPQALQLPPKPLKPSLHQARKPAAAGPGNRKVRRASAARARHQPRS